MSRSGYCEDGDYDYLFRANVDRAIAGKRGQAFLRDLIAALEAMPVKRLISHDLRDGDGEVCAIGAVGLARGVDMSKLDPENPSQVGKAFGISTVMAQEIVFENDERMYWRNKDESDEQRWIRMHSWAKKNLKEHA